MSPSLIGFRGQARFPYFLRVMVTHLGHASLRSLVDAVRAPLHAYVGLDVESLALRRASLGAADIFGFFYYQAGHVYMPEMARTSSSEGRPCQDCVSAVQIMPCLPPDPDGIQYHPSTCGGARRRVCGQRRPPHDGGLWYGLIACPMI